MDLSLREAAQLMGKTARQMRYLIRTGRLNARKDGARWVIARETLPLGPAQIERGLREQARLREVVETALGTAAAGEKKRRYSVTDLKPFQAGQRILPQIRQALGADSVAARRLTEALSLIACGCHSFHRRDKVLYLGRAREHACHALTALLLSDSEQAPALAAAIETELLPTLGGMLRSAERRR